MKPDAVREVRRARSVAEAARGEALERYLRGEGDRDRVRPELIPTERDLVEVQRRARELMRRANGTPQGAKRSRLLRDIVEVLARLVFLERVLGLERLDRAALTPRRLEAMSMVSRSALQDMQAKIKREGL